MATQIGTGPLQWHDVTLVLDTSQYTDGYLLADVVELPDFFLPANNAALVQSLHVLDEDDQGVALDVLFVNADTTWGTFNEALAISDAIARSIVGAVEVVSGDYVDLGGSQLAIPQFNPFLVAASSRSQKSLWVAAVSRGAGTYTASGVRLRIGVLR